MAKRGFGRGGDIGSQLGSLFRTAVRQLGTVGEVVAEKSKTGRAQLDVMLLKRKRKDALAALGEVVARLARNGKIDEGDYPDLSGPLSRIDQIDEQIESAENKAKGHGAGDYEPAGHRDPRDDEDLDAEHVEGDVEEYDEPDDDDPPGDDDPPADDAPPKKRRP